MENLLSKIVTWVLYLFIIVFIIFMLAPAWFIDANPIKEVAKINEGYYVVKDINTPRYGFMIQCTLNNANNGASGEIVAQNCNDIYYNNDTIIYSKILVQGGDTTYHIIPINPNRADGLRNNPIQIKEATFNNNISRFNKVNLPDTTKL